MMPTPTAAGVVLARPSGVTQRRVSGQAVTLPQVYLHPGQVHVSAEPCAVTTVLGSCVAVCLYDTRLKVGGMNHFLLPDSTGDLSTAGRHGESATLLLLERMFAIGASADTMTARVVGGANMLAALRALPTLGERNAAVAHSVLHEHGVLVTSQDVGGTNGRKLVFSTRDGIAWIKTIGR
jgi:chemotaxis protein CheD